MQNVLMIAIAAAVVIAAIVALILVSYVKAPPDTAFIITGAGRKKVLIGHAGLCLPLVNRLDRLLLRQVSVDIKTNGYIPTKDFIGVDIDAIAKVAVMSDKEMVKVPDPSGDQVYPPGDPMEGKHYRLVPGIDLAMKNFLNMKEEQIVKALTDSLQGNMREIIGTMELRVISSDRKAFGDQVQEKAQSDMNNLGIKIISCNIQKVIDENGLINALGQDNMSKIQKEAAIAKAEAERDVAIKQAETSREANDAKVIANLEIAQKNNELALKQAELKKFEDTKAAEADAAYEIQKQEQQKVIGVKATDASIAKTEQEAILRQKQVEVRQQELEAEINRKADADKYQKQKAAEAALIEKQKAAEAALYNQQKQSEAERVIAETEKYKAIQDAEAKKALAEAQRYAAEQEAAGIKAKYDAEAAGIQARGLAEAEAMEKKAEAMKKYGQAAILEMIVSVLPDVAKAVAEPLSSIDKVTVFAGGTDGGNGVSGISANVPTVMAQTFETVKAATGVDLVDIVKASGYDAKVTRNINVSGLEGSDGTAANAVTAAAVTDAVTGNTDTEE